MAVLSPTTTRYARPVRWGMRSRGDRRCRWAARAVKAQHSFQFDAPGCSGSPRRGGRNAINERHVPQACDALLQRSTPGAGPVGGQVRDRANGVDGTSPFRTLLTRRLVTSRAAAIAKARIADAVSADAADRRLALPVRRE